LYPIDRFSDVEVGGMIQTVVNICVMITTLNRVQELRRTLGQLRVMTPPPAEIWVVADGCTDGTVEFLRRCHPEVRVIEHLESLGSVASRAEVMKQVAGDLVLALDDDSYPEQIDCLARLAGLFEERPGLAIATFPQRTDEYPETLECQDFGEMRPVRSFPNSGACLRVSAYRSLPGFEPMFFHMYEEPDYALQCLANGWDVVLFPEVTIRHHYSSLARSELRNHHRHARNEFWSTLMRCPFPQAFFFAGYRLLSQARFALGRGPGWLVREPLWWAQAVKGIPAAMRRRKAVSWEGYKRWLNYR
jgi:GT2 family glycosyltransferase